MPLARGGHSDRHTYDDKILIDCQRFSIMRVVDPGRKERVAMHFFVAEAFRRSFRPYVEAEGFWLSLNCVWTGVEIVKEEVGFA
mgnify:CR=1 FL=1